MSGKDFRGEIQRIKKVSDMMCTAHSILRDSFSFKARTIDLCIMASSVWLVAMVFVEPAIGTKLSFPGIPSNIWVGLLSIFTFFLSIVQFKVSWKEKSEAHNRSVDFFSSVKRECVYILTQDGEITLDKCKHLFDKYDSSGDLTIPIPEKKFLALKKKHKQKIFISRYFDRRPWTFEFYLRVIMLVRDNKKFYLSEANGDDNDKSARS